MKKAPKLLKWFSYAALTLVMLIVLFISTLGLTSFGNRFVEDKVSALLSDDNTQVKIENIDGLLSGNLVIGSVTLSDLDGEFGSITNAQINWSPLSLLTATFSAQSIIIDNITLNRAPLETEKKPGEQGSQGFSLPVNINVESISLPDIQLGASLTGHAFQLEAKGSALADAAGLELNLHANRKDIHEAALTAEINFQPKANILKLNINLSEPEGGILANLLTLAAEPSVNIKIDGNGPLSDWKGNLTAHVAEKNIFNLTGTHQVDSLGTRNITVKGGGNPEQLLPNIYKQLFNGTTNIDLSTSITQSGIISIEGGNIETGALLLTASGIYDTHGQNDISATLIGTEGPISLNLPIEDGELIASVNGAELSLSGDANTARLKAAVSLQSIIMPQGRFDGIQLTANSDSLNLENRTGTIDTILTVAETALNSSQLNRTIRAPLTLNAPISLSKEKIAFEGVTLESPTIGGTSSGTYDLLSKTIASNIRLFISPSVLPDEMASKLSKTIAFESFIKHTIGGELSVENLLVKSEIAEANGNLSLKENIIIAQIGGRILELESFSPQAKGALGFELKANGSTAAPKFDLSINSAKATLAGKPLEALKIHASGVADANAPQAIVSASGRIDGQEILGEAEIVQSADGTQVPILKLNVGNNHLTGKIDLSPDFLPRGDLNFDFPDLSLLAALAAQQVSGDLKGTVSIDNTSGITQAHIDATSASILAQGTTVSNLNANISIADLSRLVINGQINAERIISGDNSVIGLKLDIKNQDNLTNFNLSGNLDGAPLVLKGQADTNNKAILVNINTLSVAPRGIPLNLASPATITILDDIADLKAISIKTGSGLATINGKAGSALDLTVVLNAIPTSLANAFVSQLDATGTLSGNIAIKGSASNPRIDYAVNLNGFSISQTKAAGLDSLNIKTTGGINDNTLKIQTDVTGAAGLAISGGGSVNLANSQALSLDFTGKIPFTAIAALTAQQGITLDGSANTNLQIRGTTTAPNIQGTITTDGTRLTDIRRNLTLNKIGATVTFNGSSAVLSRLEGSVASGGKISGSGSVGFAPNSGIPVDLTLNLNNAVYNDGTLVTTSINGPITITGQAIGGLSLKGSLTLDKSSITIPEKLPSSLTAIDIQHRNASAAVNAQVKELNANRGSGNEKTSPIALDLTIDAPNGIFIRGRGVDAELTGKLTIRGTAENPIVSGGLDMRRGRLEILTKRLDFTSGSISFGGGLIPLLNMKANSSAGSTTITVSVSGNANDPEFSFSSSPALPQDEVMAQLIFGQSMSKLSPLQIARLADAAAQLAGGNSSSLFNSLRSGLGIDDLDISTDAEGQARVSAGKYLNERTYLELEQGNQGPKAVINLDIGKGIKLRGEAGANGSGSAGIFYEKEY